jgi:hypothetical protein
VGLFTDNKTTPTTVVLSCFGLLVGLWQKDNDQEMTNSKMTALK